MASHLASPGEGPSNSAGSSQTQTLCAGCIQDCVPLLAHSSSSLGGPGTVLMASAVGLVLFCVMHWGRGVANQCSVAPRPVLGETLV